MQKHCVYRSQNWRFVHQWWHSFLKLNSNNSAASPLSLGDSIKIAVSNKSYVRIPDILSSAKDSSANLSPSPNTNPFSFLSTFQLSSRTQVIDEILQSFISIRPWFRLQVAYDYLLTFILQSSSPFPLTLTVLQRTLRSGCTPVQQTHLLLSSAWIENRFQSQSVVDTLLGMKSIGYHPDCGTCNYIIASLCAVDQLEEAVEVLRGMVGAAVVPNVDSYGTIIAAMCTLRKTSSAQAMMNEMVGKCGLSPRQGTIMKLVSSLTANKEIWRAVEMIEFLEGKGFHVGFESYEHVVEECLECGEFVLAGKLVMMMTEKGFIPYIKVRQKVVEGLVGVGEWKLACAVRHRLAKLNS